MAAAAMLQWLKELQDSSRDNASHKVVDDVSGRVWNLLLYAMKSLYSSTVLQDMKNVIAVGLNRLHSAPTDKRIPWGKPD
jgi:hypothetical protein